MKMANTKLVGLNKSDQKVLSQLTELSGRIGQESSRPAQAAAIILTTLVVESHLLRVKEGRDIYQTCLGLIKGSEFQDMFEPIKSDRQVLEFRKRCDEFHLFPDPEDAA